MRILAILAITCGLQAGAASADDGPGPSSSVAEIQARHDRALLRDLARYIDANPKADDLERAYMALFDKVIEHDWFADHEAVSLRYLREYPDGAVRSLAQIVGTMARAQSDDFPTALVRFQELMRGLGRPEQEEFAANFADTLAASATGAGQYAVARQVYQALLDRYGDSPTLREKIRGELARLDRVGKPAPEFSARDVAGKELSLSAFRGKYVLLDFWATWCAPCVAELPRLQAAYAAYGGRGFEIVGISLDETKAAVTDFVKARGIPWRQVHNATAEADLIEAFGITTIPATFLIDPDGRIIRLELRGAALERALEGFLGKPAALGKAESSAPLAR